jgi:hypothetical protein
LAYLLEAADVRRVRITHCRTAIPLLPIEAAVRHRSVTVHKIPGYESKSLARVAMEARN